MRRRRNKIHFDIRQNIYFFFSKKLIVIIVVVINKKFHLIYQILNFQIVQFILFYKYRINLCGINSDQKHKHSAKAGPLSNRRHTIYIFVIKIKNYACEERRFYAGNSLFFLSIVRNLRSRATLDSRG